MRHATCLHSGATDKRILEFWASHPRPGPLHGSVAKRAATSPAGTQRLFRSLTLGARENITYIATANSRCIGACFPLMLTIGPHSQTSVICCPTAISCTAPEAFGQVDRARPYHSALHQLLEKSMESRSRHVLICSSWYIMVVWH